MILKAVRRLASPLNNPILLFTLCRYFAYLLLFARGLLVAKYLGPFLFGIFGFLSLLLNYLLYAGIGLNFAINVNLSTGGNTVDAERDKKISVALILTFTIACGLFVLGACIQLFNIPLFDKYLFNKYALAIGLISGSNLLQHVLINVHRYFGNLKRIAFYELFSAVVLLIVALSFKGETLIDALLISMVFTAIVSLITFMVLVPFKYSLCFDVSIAKHLFSLGIPLLVYNASFYLITFSAQTIISIFYSIETMGYYSLAGSITNAVLLGLNSVTWVVFPKILSKTSFSVDDGEVRNTVQKINSLYGTAVFSVVFIAILFLPGLFYFLPQYKPVLATLNILLLSQAVLALCFGYNCVAIARNMQMVVAKISLFSVLIVTVLCLVVASLQLNSSWVAISVLVGSIVFTILQAKISSKIISKESIQKVYLKDILPLGSLLAIICFIIGSLTGIVNTWGIVGIIVFVITNKKQLFQLKLFCEQKLNYH